MVTIVRADSPGLWSVSIQLFDEYVASLPVSLEFQNVGYEREHLAQEYGTSHGALLLARDDDAWVGCGAWRHFSNTRCEMKRLYVRPQARGQGVGRALATALVDDARRRGYRTMLLDTWPTMVAAQALYESLGFQAVEAYRHNPVVGTRFFQLAL